jgi:hypothetical protein
MSKEIGVTELNLNPPVMMTPPILTRLLLDEGDIVDNDKVDDMNRQVTATRVHAGVRGGGGLVAAVTVTVAAAVRMNN